MAYPEINTSGMTEETNNTLAIVVVVTGVILMLVGIIKS